MVPIKINNNENPLFNQKLLEPKITLEYKLMELEHELNEIIYELYGLNEEEINYIKDSLL